MRPISPAVRLRLSQRIMTVKQCSPADAVLEATKLINFLDSAGLDLVMPGWVPIEQDGPRPPRPLSWDDLPKVPDHVLEREPWRPYDA